MEGINISVSDIAIHLVTHILVYIIMRDTGMSEVCGKGVSAPGTAWLDFPAHTFYKTTYTFLDILVFHCDALPFFGWSLRISIYVREHKLSTAFIHL